LRTTECWAAFPEAPDEMFSAAISLYLAVLLDETQPRRSCARDRFHQLVSGPPGLQAHPAELSLVKIVGEFHALMCKRDRTAV
jgi:hypothetical protein